MGALPTYGPWIDWAGRTKRCPLPAGTRHQVRFRDGSTANDDCPESWDWKHTRKSPPVDIVAYRIQRSG